VNLRPHDPMIPGAAEHEPSRHFTRIFLAVVVAGLMTSVGFAVLVDPLRTFGTGRIPSVLTAEHYSKPEAFLRLRRPVQAIVLGTSRVMKLNPACIEELTGYPAFNFGLSSSHIEDWVAAYRFAGEHSTMPLRELVIGVDVEVFDNHAEPDPRLMSSRYLRGYLDDSVKISLGTVSRALFGWQALRFGLSSLWYHLRPGTIPTAKLRFDDVGFAHYDAWEAAISHGTFDKAAAYASVAAKFRGERSGERFDALSPERTAAFRTLVRSAHAAGVRVDVYVPPLSPQLRAILHGPILRREAETEALLEELEREGSIRYFHIRGFEDFHGDPDDYFDGAHMSERNSTRVLLAMFHREHGCGQ
jgi:hypothetical protein